MTMFIWSSTALKNYRRGYLIAVADDIEQAKTQVREMFKLWLRENRPHLFEADMVDPFFTEDHDKRWAELEADLAAEPNISTTMLIEGSD